MIIWDCVEAKRYLSRSVRDEISYRLQRELEEHISDCGECATELELTRELYSLRDAAPPDLLPRIKKAVRVGTVDLETNVWKQYLPAAALIAFLISGGLIDRVFFLPEISALEQDFFVEVWPSEDHDLAGSLVLDNLSDESLNLLFEEIR